MASALLQVIKSFFHRIIGTQQLKYLQINTYCNTLLNNVMPNYYLPRTYMSINSYGLAYIINEIVINRRRNIIEFGSGISTIFIARIAKINNLKIKLISIDEDLEWIETIKNILINQGINDFVTLVHAPVIKRNEPVENYWYDEKLLDKITTGKKFDMVIVDGPKVSDSKKEMIRLQAMFFLRDNLAENYFVYLDDANRKGEKKILNRWRMELNISFEIKNQCAIAYKGLHFSANPVI